jgi:AraC-like DNA-binding protein
MPSKTPSPKEPAVWRAKPAFRVLAAGMSVDLPGTAYGPRTRRHYELVWMIEGDAQARFDGHDFYAPEGAVLLRGPGVRDEYTWSPLQRTVHAFIHFDLDPPRRRALSRENPPPLRLPPPNDILRPLFGYLLHLAEQKEPLRSRLMLPGLDLLLQAYAAGALQQKPAPAAVLQAPVAKAMDAILGLLRADPAALVDAEALARSAHCSSVHLSRLFKQDLGLGPQEYARLLRLDRSARQLRLTALSLKEIALGNGFYDAKHFVRQFSKVYGLAPNAFRASELSEWLTQRNPLVRKLYPILDNALTRKA